MAKEELKNGLRVARIKNGTVIDRLPPENVFKVLDILGILKGTDFIISVVINVFSEKLGRQKAIVKIEGRGLTKRETEIITIIAPEATINIIKDFHVVEKRSVSLPVDREIKGILVCPNSSCITNDPRERGGADSRFVVIEKDPLTVRCHFCETLIRGAGIPAQIK